MGPIARVGWGGDWALAVIVLVHLGISLVHGRAHVGARVFLPLAGSLFVYIVILGGPLVGLALLRRRPRTGAWIIAASFGGALIFGLVNHFVIAGADHVGSVSPEWRTLFGATAALLAASEVVGAATGVWYALRDVRGSA